MCKGIHSVDVKVACSGHGCVNWNGPVSIRGDSGTEIKNHSIPKMRGFTNKTGDKSDKGYEYKISAHEIDPKATPMYISENCIKYHLFRDIMPRHLVKQTKDDYKWLLRSQAGLVRGYAIAANPPLMKASSLLVEDFVEQDGRANFEIFSVASEHSADVGTGGFYSKTTYGDTKYVGSLSINLEKLQFISCDGIFGRAATPPMTEVEAKDFAAQITSVLKNMDPELNPIAEYNKCWVRKGQCIPVGEAGILLNQDAMLILVNDTINRIKNLYISQGRGWMKVKEAIVDYNDGSPMRIKDDEYSVNKTKNGEFAIYYRPATDEEIERTEIERGAMKSPKSKSSKRGSRKAAKKSREEEAQEMVNKIILEQKAEKIEESVAVESVTA